MSLIMDQYEYINEDSIKDELKCIICTQPFQSPVSLECKHTFCRSCIDTWITHNNPSCPICRHPSEPQSMFINTTSDILLNQLDSLLVRCLKCNSTDIKRANIDAHFKRCPKKKITKTPSMLRKPWHSMKTMMRKKHHRQTKVTIPDEIVLTNYEQGNVFNRELPIVEYGRYQQREQRQQQYFHSYARIPPESSFIARAVTGFFEALLGPLIAIFLQFMMIPILLFFVVILILLLYLGIFWKMLAVTFIVWLNIKLWRTN